MDGRTSIWVSLLTLTLGCAGCVSTPNQKDVAGNPAPPPTTVTRNTDVPVVKPKKDDGPKRNPKPSTEVAIGEIKEMEADSENARSQPEMQARFRDDARKAYQHAIQLDPNCLDAYRHLAMLYSKMGQHDRALDVYKTVLAKAPKDAKKAAELWYELGLCHNRRKDFNESVRCFHKALEMDPENRNIMKTLGFTLAWMGQTDEGLKYFSRTQGAAMAHYNIAQVLIQRDRPTEAQRHLELAVRENPQLEQARELLAEYGAPATAAVQLGGPITP